MAGDTELMVGLVGALGADLGGVANVIRAQLTDTFSYGSETISISSLMRGLSWERDLAPDAEDLRIKANMDAGRDLNEDWYKIWERNDALARLAILKIMGEREDRNRDAGAGEKELQKPLERFAFIMRSFKRPHEIELLRAVYGERFVVFGVYAPRKRRRKALYDLITPAYASDQESEWHDDEALRIDALMARDERERGEAGQDVRDTFHRADFFIDDDPAVRVAQVSRALRTLFGDPFVTPTRDETGMAFAATAARRSAEPGRQVGAALTTDAGDLLTVGCNEVPRAFGGQYGAEDAHDGREFVKGPMIDGVRYDTNNVEQDAIADDLLAALRARLAGPVARLRVALKQAADPDKSEITAALDAVAALDERETVLESRLGDITEFGRAVHAEMAAITTAARLGIPVQNAVLYTTTFPCHNCARHVIVTGIKRLVYVAPYAKSRAYKLHDDALVVAPDGQVADKVVFEPFIGVAPRRYHHLFFGHDRKHDDGRLRTFDPVIAVPRLQDADPPQLGLDTLGYSVRETAVADAMSMLSDTAVRLSRSADGEEPS